MELLSIKLTDKFTYVVLVTPAKIVQQVTYEISITSSTSYSLTFKNDFSCNKIFY